MKKSILFGLILLSAVSCGRHSYTISGKVDLKGSEGAAVTLECGDLVQKTKVEGGEFFLKGEIAEPAIAVIGLGTGERATYCKIVLEPHSKLEVFFGDECTCSGTPLNEENTVYQLCRKGFLDARRNGLKEIIADASLTDAQKEEKANAVYQKFYTQAGQLYTEVFENHSNDVLGIEALMFLQDSRESFDSLYAIAGEAVRRSEMVQSEKARYEILAKTAPGAMFQDFTIENGAADGSAVSLSDYVGKGKYVLVDFWASWCGPCKGEMPNLANVYRKYKGDSFEIVGVAVWDRRSDTEEALGTLPISWPVIFDAQTVPTDLYGIDGIPQIILFGPDGTILARDLRGPEIAKTIEQYL